MPTFRECLLSRLADPEFRAGYDSWCEACACTVEIVGRIHAAGVAVPDLARQLGLTSEQLEAFIDAERCEYVVMDKLCGHFGLIPPADCPRRGRR